MNRMLGEGDRISGVHLAVDSAAWHKLFDSVKATPTTSFITLQHIALKRFRETLAENILIMVTVYVVLAGIIAFGVVYNLARISLSEQAREMATCGSWVSLAARFRGC